MCSRRSIAAGPKRASTCQPPPTASKTRPTIMVRGERRDGSSRRWRQATNHSNPLAATMVSYSLGPSADARSTAGRISGNRITSRIDGWSVSSMTRRSMPIPSPAVGGNPYSRARQ